MLLTDCVEEFMVECTLRRFSKRTIKGYVNNNLFFATYLKNEDEVEKVEGVKPPHIKQYTLYFSQPFDGALLCKDYKDIFAVDES